MLSQNTRRESRIDAFVCLLLIVASSIYLILRRWPLGSADEAYYFYHAIRMLEGEVLYRDVFELTTPLLMDLLALAFKLFGATFNTARAVGSVIQGLLLVVVYAGVRTVGGARPLAIGVAMVQLSIAQPAWPYTTPHWLAALLVCALLLLSLDRQRARAPGSVVAQGLLLGLLLATRQHAGLAVVVGMALLVLTDAIADRQWGQTQGPPVGRHLLTLAGATLAGGSLILGPHLLQAGIGPMLDQLVIHPLTGYRDFNQVTWGTNYLLEHAPYTFPTLLKYLPVVVAITTLRAAAARLRQGERCDSEKLLVLAVFGACTITYTMSFPDATHLALIMPVILIVAAELLTAMFRVSGRWNRQIQTTLGAVLIVACAVQLQRNYAGALAQYPIQHATEFGSLPFAKSSDVDVVEEVKRRLAQGSGNELFCYTGWSAIYLMTGARNPTRHELVFPGYQSEEEVRDVIDTLERKRVERILLMRPFIKPGDPIDAYVQQRYRCANIAYFEFCERHDEE